MLNFLLIFFFINIFVILLREVFFFIDNINFIFFSILFFGKKVF